LSRQTKVARETVRATRALNSNSEKLAPAGVEYAFFIRPLIGVRTEEVTLCLNDMCELIVFFVSVSSVSIRKNARVAKTGYASVFVSL
jgi:hypothetical protein